MIPRLHVPRDSVAVSVGADDVAAALAEQAPDLPLKRNSSRGMFWLEPLIEVENEGVRYGYGPATPDDVPSILDAVRTGADHPLALGPVEDMPYLKRQQRVTFARAGVTDPLSLTDYRAHGGISGLEHALRLTSEEIVQEVTDSGLRGRGGAGFPTGIKWKTSLQEQADQKYICCNADEGDSGTFADRMVMEGDPFLLIEGMIIAGLAVGATRGYVYIRSEYPDAIKTMQRAIEIAEAEGMLGDSILHDPRGFHLQVRRGAGAYICGEESSMLNSIEGKRGEVRTKPPIPAIEGLHGKPTIINNVLSLAAVPTIMARGAAYYRDFGEGHSLGTKPFQLAGNIARGGLVERGFGCTLRELIEDFGGGTATGRPVRAVQLGGPLGAYVGTASLDMKLGYESAAAENAMLGHGGIVVFDDTVDMADQARFAMEFCAVESCGKCTPCRLGAVRGVEVIDRITNGQDREKNTALLRDLLEVMESGSLCAMGGLTPMPVKSALDLFPQDFERAAQ